MAVRVMTQGDYVTGQQAKRLVGWNWYRLHRETIVGNIGALVEPSGKIRFCRADLEKLAAREPAN